MPTARELSVTVPARAGLVDRWACRSHRPHTDRRPMVQQVSGLHPICRGGASRFTSGIVVPAANYGMYMRAPAACATRLPLRDRVRLTSWLRSGELFGSRLA